MLGLSERILHELIERTELFQKVGQIQSIQGTITVALPAAIGELCQIRGKDGRTCLAEVIGFSGDLAQIMPFGPSENLQRGDEVVALNKQMRVPVGYEILGRVLNATGQPIDDAGPLASTRWAPVIGGPPLLRFREIISNRFSSPANVRSTVC